MGTCGQPGYVFRDFCLKQGIDFISFCLKQGIFSWTINSLRVCCTNVLESVLNRAGKSAIFVFNRVRVWGAEPHLPTQGYIEYPPEYTPLPEIKRVSYTLFKRQRGKRYLVERCIPVKSVYMGPYISPSPRDSLPFRWYEFNFCVRTLNLCSYERMRFGLA